jgi:hypothetical protein
VPSSARPSEIKNYEQRLARHDSDAQRNQVMMNEVGVEFDRERDDASNNNRGERIPFSREQVHAQESNENKMSYRYRERVWLEVKMFSSSEM